MAKSTTKIANGGKPSASKARKVPSKKVLSQEQVVDSDEGSSSSSESEEVSSSSEDESTAEKSTSATASGSGEAEVSDEELSPSSTEPSSSSEDEDDLTAQAPPKASQPARPTTMAEAPRTRFAPPSGYAKVEAYNASSILDLSSLGSKQLWHITIPRGISINDLTSVSQDGLDSKTTVLTHKGTEYTFADAAQPGQEGVNKALLLPSSSEKAYRSRPVSVSRSIRLQPKVSLPNVPNRQTDVATGSSAAGQTTRLAVSSIRPQPKGLKMRYKPPGFGSGRPGTIGSGSEDSDTDMEDAPPANQGFRRPNIAASTAQSAQTNGTKASPAKKRKLDEAKSSTPAKSKSKKSSAAPPATPPAEDPESDPEPTAQPTPKDSKHLTKEERAARRQRKAERAEKRAKKANAG